ncbi:sigma-54 interaction domain-containing protein [Pseudomonas indica]|uniref:sigma-54 interaction domain-containing protein n=1 Tax=Pseudomonas indica TaxID=137658 RepID=UPI0023F925BE|nr:sigma-54 dependent transcriptional regulator [Pseudomonas indica]MBU3057637.1 sigma-54 dependent transcriptional regulator [Pseudomonas indica]
MDLSAHSPSRYSDIEFVGASASVLKLLKIADDVSETNAPILITGECGTGKEILARRIHQRSQRRNRPYVAVNCGAIASSLEESELFGYVPGAFTGANKRKQGLFEAANHGTVFLDEIGESSPGLQVKLLRVLQDGDYVPVGSAQTHRCDVRMIAATNRDLCEALGRGAFRADLYYRLDVVRLRVPPLRERMEDIPLLTRHFVTRYARTYGLSTPEIRSDFYAKLLQQDYPGNVRELSNYVHRAVVLSGGAPLTAALLDQLPPTVQPARPVEPAPPPRPSVPAPSAAGIPFHEAKKHLIETFEREYLIAVLNECGGIIYRAAKLAGMSERGFHQKLRHYGIDGTGFRSGT